MAENETDIVHPSELDPVFDEKIVDVAKQISAAVRSQKQKYTGRMIAVGIPGKIPNEFWEKLAEIFKGNGWHEIRFTHFDDPDPGDPRSSDYTTVNLWTCPDYEPVSGGGR